ncbi:MAG: hypothetical protein ACI4Q3_09435 [Kiritimatiellia bacterium]
MSAGRNVRRVGLGLLVFAAWAAGASGGEAPAGCTGDVGRAHWHLGPFFEYRRSDPGPVTFWAVRPFYSHCADPGTDAVVRDVLWPLGTYHGRAGTVWWRALVAFGDARENDPSWSCDVFPLWFSGAARTGDGYWGFFPFYGRHPHVLLMDDWQYVLWPLWQTYTVKGVRSRAVCWPFVTWREAPREGVGVWPLYGYGTQRESEHSYLLWPLVTWASYRADRDTSGAGSSWMLWPLYAQVRRERESQTMVLPPFFAQAQTDSATRTRILWPLVEILRSRVRDRLSVWPLFETVDGYSYADGKKAQAEEKTWRLGWQLVEHTTLETRTTRETRFNFFPFFTWERRWRKSSGTDELTSSYLRVWPFWSQAEEQGLKRMRTLDLNPIRHAGGIDRNWAPFWTLWAREDDRPGRTRQFFLFNFLRWQSCRDGKDDNPETGPTP